MTIPEEPIIVEHTFNTSADKVWNAITKPDQMKQWYFDSIEAFEPVVGFKTQFIVQANEKSYHHHWHVTKVEPGKKISYNWKYEGIPGDSNVSFELSEKNGQTKLILTHKVLESFPQDVPEFKRESGLAGWKYFIQDSLKGYLENS